MAVFGVDFYGMSTYGLLSAVQFDASPFVAESVDYDKVLISWTNPGGAWTEMRLVKNMQGYPIHESDGQILLDTSAPTHNYTDFSVSPGRFQYYGLYVYANGSWVQAGMTSCLVIADFGSTKWLLEHLPRYYRYTSPTDSTTKNVQFERFMKVFGWALDYLRTSYDALRFLNDPSRAHLANVTTLAQQFGITVDSDTAGHLLRQQVANVAHIAREHGTLAGLRKQIQLVTGWDADIQISGNMLLDDDQSSFLNPLFPGWDPGMNYATGEQVVYNGYLYQAKTGGAYGNAQAPSGTNTSNTWWSVVQDVVSTLYLQNSKTGNLSTWEALPYTAGVTSSQLGIYLGTGIQSATDSTVNSSNALAVQNNSTTAADVGLRSVSRLVGQTGMDPLQPIGDGIPLPVIYETWDPTETYTPGMLVMWAGRPWLALRSSTGVQPPDSWRNPTPEWTAAGADSRIRYMISGYTHVPITGSGAPTAPVVPFVEWYDYQGNLIAHVDSRAAGHAACDSFTDPTAFTAGRSFEYGAGYTWTTPVGSWVRDGYLGGTARPANVGTRSVALTTGDADCQVAVTLRTPQVSGQVQGIIFRYTDDNNYWRATRSSIVKKVSGVLTSVGTYSKAVADGDRLKVVMQGSVITVYRNGVQVYTVTDSFNSTATKHGMLVE